MSTSLSQPHRNAVLDGIERERLERADLAQRDELVAGIARRMVAVERPPAALPVKKPVASVTQEQAQAALRQQVVARIGAVGRNRERKHTKTFLQPLGFPVHVGDKRCLYCVVQHFTLKNPREHERLVYWFETLEGARAAFPSSRLLELPDYKTGTPAAPEPLAQRNAAAILGRKNDLRVVDDRGTKLLSPRLDQCAALVADGRSNKEIAREMGLTQNTIKKYLVRAFDQLGVSSRTELALHYINHAQPQAAAEPGGAA
jgi:DNA-binding CsgD family transcriptional regulator